MSIKGEIKKGIGTHGKWKQRIKQAIQSGESEWTPEVVRQDNQCEFGKWLYSCPSNDQSSAYYENVKSLHAQFHQSAAEVLEMALAGKKDEAEAAIDMGSDYSDKTTSLTREMMAWHKSVS